MRTLLTTLLLAAAPAYADVPPERPEPDEGGCGCVVASVDAAGFGVVYGSLALLVVGARRR